MFSEEESEGCHNPFKRVLTHRFSVFIKLVMTCTYLGTYLTLPFPKKEKKNLDRVYMFVAHPAFNNFLRPASIASTSLSVHDSAVPPP